MVVFVYFHLFRGALGLGAGARGGIGARARGRGGVLHELGGAELSTGNTGMGGIEMPRARRMTMAGRRAAEESPDARGAQGPSRVETSRAGSAPSIRREMCRCSLPLNLASVKNMQTLFTQRRGASQPSRRRRAQR